MNKPFLTLSLPGFVADAELTGWVGGGGEERNNHYEASKVHDFKWGDVATEELAFSKCSDQK